MYLARCMRQLIAVLPQSLRYSSTCLRDYRDLLDFTDSPRAVVGNLFPQSHSQHFDQLIREILGFPLSPFRSPPRPQLPV